MAAAPVRRLTDDVPADVERRLRRLCLALPDAYEEHAWVGTRWRVRTRTFAHVLGVDDPVDGAHVVMTFRAAGEELEALRHAGPPFHILGWGRDAMGLTLDDATDWDEVADSSSSHTASWPRGSWSTSSTARTPPRPPVVIMPCRQASTGHAAER